MQRLRKDAHYTHLSCPTPPLTHFLSPMEQSNTVLLKLDDEHFFLSGITRACVFSFFFHRRFQSGQPLCE